MYRLWLGSALAWLFAQSGTGDLILISETGEPFRLYINGEWLSDAPVTRAEAHDLPEGTQRATVYVYPTEGRVIQLRRSFYVEAGMVEQYALRKRKGQYVVVLYNRTPRPVDPTPSAPPVAQPFPPTTPPATGGAPSQNQNTTIVFNPTIQVQTGGGTQISSSGAPAAPPMPGTAVPGTGSSYAGPCNCLFPMSRESFAQALNTLRQEPFDQTRLEIARSIARQNCLLAQDVREMMRALDFEDNRLELARFAYDYTHDLSNYFVVNEAFQFSSSREALMRYIQSRPARQQCTPTMGIGMPSPVPGMPSQRPPCTPCMTPQAAAQAITTLRGTASDLTRLETAKQIVSTNCPTSEQIRDMCRTLNSEINRLDFAKYAYTRACDPQNYFVVNQALSSTLSQQELAQYIQSLGR